MAMYIIRLKDGRRWKVREAVSLEAACRAITSARVMGAIGQKDIYDQTRVGGGITVRADVIQINSDGSERQPYTEAY